MGEKKISRKDFLAVVAGMAGAAVLAKFVGFKKAATTIASLKDSQGAYGNSPYGGKTL
jgi:hypothetical protein